MSVGLFASSRKLRFVVNDKVIKIKIICHFFFNFFLFIKVVFLFFIKEVFYLVFLSVL